MVVKRLECQNRLDNAVSQNKSLIYLILFVAEIEMLFYSGIFYGLNSLLPTLKTLSYFTNLCNMTAYNITGSCVIQSQLFGYAIITGVASCNVLALPLGAFFYKLGYKNLKIFASALALVGGIIFAISSITNNLLLFPAQSFLGIMGQALCVCNFPLGALIPKYQNIIVSIFSGSFDSAVVVFILVSLTFTSGVSLLGSFLAIGISGLVIMLLDAGFLMGAVDLLKFKKLDGETENRDKDVVQQENTTFLDLTSVNNPEDSNIHKEDPSEENGPPVEIIQGSDGVTIESKEQPNEISTDTTGDSSIKIDEVSPENQRKDETNTDIQNRYMIFEEHKLSLYPTAKSVLGSRYYLLQLMYMVTLFFRFTFFMAELSLMLSFNFPNSTDQVSYYLFMSSFFFSNGIFIAPVAGIIVDFLKNRVTATDDPHEFYKSIMSSYGIPLIFCALTNELVCIFVIIPQTWAVYAAYAAMTVTRSFLFALNAAYIVLAFPDKFFGIVFGVCLTCCGCVSFLQFPLLLNNPVSLNIVNYFLIALSAVPLVHPIILLLKI